MWTSICNTIYPMTSNILHQSISTVLRTLCGEICIWQPVLPSTESPLAFQGLSVLHYLLDPEEYLCHLLFISLGPHINCPPVFLTEFTTLSVVFFMHLINNFTSYFISFLHCFTSYLQRKQNVPWKQSNVFLFVFSELTTVWRGKNNHTDDQLN